MSSLCTNETMEGSFVCMQVRGKNLRLFTVFNCHQAPTYDQGKLELKPQTFASVKGLCIQCYTKGKGPGITFSHGFYFIFHAVVQIALVLEAKTKK